MQRPAHYAKRTRGKIMRLTGDEEEFRLTCDCGCWVSMVVGADWQKLFSPKVVKETEQEVWRQLQDEFGKQNCHCRRIPEVTG